MRPSDAHRPGPFGPILVVLLVLGSAPVSHAMVEALCGDRIAIWPGVDSVPTNAIWLLSVAGPQAEESLHWMAECAFALRSGNRPPICLRAREHVVSRASLVQFLLEPVAALPAGETVELIVGAGAGDRAEMLEDRMDDLHQTAWRVGGGPDLEPPTWSGPPRVEEVQHLGRSRLDRFREPDTEFVTATLAVPLDDPTRTLVRIEVTELGDTPRTVGRAIVPVLAGRADPATADPCDRGWPYRVGIPHAFSFRAFDLAGHPAVADPEPARWIFETGAP